MRFAKAHGLGNDFLLVDSREAPALGGEGARRVCDRHRGVGADGLILYELAGGAAAMRLFNADGTEAEVSGNGVRCLAAHLVALEALAPRHVVRTASGPRSVEVTSLGGNRFRVGTDLGVPILASAEIPVALEPPRLQVVDHPLGVEGETVIVTATSLGNPHCALFLESPPEDPLVARIGPRLETHPFFPRRTNVEFVTVTSRNSLRVRLWERGVGPTSASGTGAASAVVAAVLTGRADRSVTVQCDGGLLEVSWPEGGPVHQVGDVEVLFEGEWTGPAL